MNQRGATGESEAASLLRSEPVPSPATLESSGGYGAVPGLSTASVPITYDENQATKSQPPLSRRARVYAFIHDSRGLFLFALAQFFGAVMALTTRFLATSLPSGQKYHALQILLVRMSITVVCSLLWMWWAKVPHFPLGQRGIRRILVARGCAGFIGVVGLYYSLSYLPLPDATVITFLVPTFLSFFCSLIPSLNEPFTGREKIGGVISLAGVILIARPTFIFRQQDSANVTTIGVKPPYVSPKQRTIAVLLALVGVLGAAIAYTTIRVIGKRAHPLISVTYLGAMTTIASLIGILAIPSVGGLLIPRELIEWALLCAIGISGFILQFLLTKGLQLEKAGRAASLVYTQLIWAVIFEWVVWGNPISLLSFCGAILILGGVAWINWQKWKGNARGPTERRGSIGGKSIEGDDTEQLLAGDGEEVEEVGKVTAR